MDEFDELETDVLDDVSLVEEELEMFFFSGLCVLGGDFVALINDSAAALTTRTSVLNHTIHTSIRDIETWSPAPTRWCF